MNKQAPAPRRTYQVGYRRVPTSSLVYHSTFRDTTVQEIMNVLSAIEADSYQVEVVYITMIPDVITNR